MFLPLRGDGSAEVVALVPLTHKNISLHWVLIEKLILEGSEVCEVLGLVLCIPED